MSTHPAPPATDSFHTQIECGTCQQALPLRMTNPGENAALWLCARCEVPFVAYAMEEELVRSAHLIQWDRRCFDVGGQPDMSLDLRREAVRIASRQSDSDDLGMRRSRRRAQSLVVPAVVLGAGFAPEGDAFKIMVADLSREGIGLVHDRHLDAKFIGLELAASGADPIQVVVRLVRQQSLPKSPYFKIGGELHARLGSAPNFDQ